MALTTRGDGTGTAFQVSSSWWNDYKNVLTGVMTDQPIQLNYRPGVANATPTLLLKTDGFNNLLRGLKSDNTTQAFVFDAVGNLTTAGGLTIVGAISGATTGVFSSTVRASSFQGPAGVAASFMVYDNALATLRAVRIFVGTTDPSTYTTVNEGDIWIKA